MSHPARYIAVYDISDDKERAKAAKILEGFGERVQESVFECYLSGNLRTRLLRRFEKLELKTGFLLLYRLQADTEPFRAGICPPAMEQEYGFVL